MTVENPLHPGPRRLRGAYYTPDDLAFWMSEWCISEGARRVLEPSFGDGAFLRAIEVARQREGRQLEVLGVEKDRATFEQAVSAGTADSASSICSDFMDVDQIMVDAAVGNPPFVRLRNLDRSESKSAQERASEALGRRMEPSGSLWLPFLLHATNFVRAGGRLALILPFEITHVRYARGIWSWLGERYGDIRLVRIHERVFEDILQDVVVLLCDDRGRTTSDVRFEAYESLSNFFSGRSVCTEKIATRDADSEGKPFTKALLSDDLRNLIDSDFADSFTDVRDLARFNIGYVSGDKEFFHPSRDALNKYSLAESGSVIPSISRTRDLLGSGLYSSEALEARASQLFLVDRDRGSLLPNELDYVERGELEGVSSRYKCRVRNPWWAVPGVVVPDVLLSVFSSTPRLVVNDGEAAASNSLLCGRLLGPTPSEFAAAWYTSFTLLECELNVHALGGGVLILIPGEVGRMRMVRPMVAREGHLSELDETLRAGRVSSAYRLGDQSVLCGQLGFTGGQVDLIRDGIETLSFWRTRGRADTDAMPSYSK